MAEKINQDCKIYGTELCSFVGCDGCEKCVFNESIKGFDEEDQAQRWRETLALFPREIDDLHDTETCAFCGKEHKNGYAELTLGHNEPEYKKGWILGMGRKVRCEIGSMIDLPIACCKNCKKMIVLQDIILYAIVIVSIAAAIGVMNIPALEKIMAIQPMLIPIAMIALFVCGGYFLAQACIKAYVKKQKNTRYINALELPIVQKMLDMGWFPVPKAKNNIPHLHFAKRKIRENFRYFSK